MRFVADSTSSLLSRSETRREVRRMSLDPRSRTQPATCTPTAPYLTHRIFAARLFQSASTFDVSVEMVFKQITSLVLQTSSWLQKQSPLRSAIQTSSHSFEWDNVRWVYFYWPGQANACNRLRLTPTSSGTIVMMTSSALACRCRWTGCQL